MAKKRYINTQFWRDSYISNLDPSEKLVFLYLITNPDTNISGIYQIPLKIIATDTGFDKDMIIKILARFERDGKVKYENGWIALKNFIKNQNERSPQVIKGIENEMENAPERLKEWVASKKVEGIDTLSYLNLDIDSDINLNSNLNTERKRFTPPTHEEIADYCNENQYPINIFTFINFYESKGWKVGKNKMEDWKAAVRGWYSRDKDSAKGKPKTTNEQEAYETAKRLGGL